MKFVNLSYKNAFSILFLNVFQLSEVSLSNPDDNVNDNLFKNELEQNILAFGFDNGQVKEVCYSSEEPLWVVNIKKGILSSFQQSMTSFDQSENITETDVVGRCKAQYISHDSRWGHKFHKIKDMYSCTGNQALYQYALNLPDINIQHLPLIQ